jgi:hypothetical protein
LFFILFLKGAFDKNTFYRHNSLILLSCCGYIADKMAASASSKSAKSKPGATVHPTKQKALPDAGKIEKEII